MNANKKQLTVPSRSAAVFPRCSVLCRLRPLPGFSDLVLSMRALCLQFFRVFMIWFACSPLVALTVPLRSAARVPPRLSVRCFFMYVVWFVCSLFIALNLPSCSAAVLLRSFVVCSALSKVC